MTSTFLSRSNIGNLKKNLVSLPSTNNIHFQEHFASLPMIVVRVANESCSFTELNAKKVIKSIY